MPGDQKASGVPRQRPVSCRFCRQRKLRCSRDAPCSNCVSRGIRCELEPPPAVPASVPSADREIVERLRKLEALVESQQRQMSQSASSLSPNSSGTSAQQSFDTPISNPSEVQNVVNDVAWLESIYNGAEGSLTKLPSTTIVFRTCPLKQVKHGQPWITQDDQYPFTYSAPARCIWLPLYAEARSLMEKFVAKIDHLHHVVHVPSLPSILDEVYGCLNQQGLVKPGSVMLLLSMFASSCHAWTKQDCEEGVLTTQAEAIEIAPSWIKAIEDILDNAHRTTAVSIEGIQGMIIISFTVGNIEGISRRCRSLWNMAIQLARELGLQCLDHPRIANSYSPVQKEMGRRVWWYLVASDWLFSIALKDFSSKLMPSRTIAVNFTGSPRGVYLCHPRQMLVKKPLNLNDEDVTDDMDGTEKPRDFPTDMSYPLHRLRLAELARSATDRTPIANGDDLSSNHDIIMDVDTHLQMLTNDVPAFFSMSISQITSTYGISCTRATKIAHQGFMLYSILNAQRCRLHLPFFSQGFVDPIYAASKDICIQSARKVIQLEVQLSTSEVRVVAHYKYLGLLLSVFISSVVLLMDLCHNKLSSQNEKQRAEVADAFRILEEARHESATVDEFLNSLMQILRKHKITPPGTVGAQQVGARSLTGCGDVRGGFGGVAMAPFGDVDMAPVSADPSILACREDGNVMTADAESANEEEFASYFNNLAQSFEQGIDVDSFDWNNILSGLNASYM